MNENPTAITDPDFEEIFLEDIKDLFYIQFEEEILNSDFVEDDLNDILEDAFQIFITIFIPERSLSKQFEENINIPITINQKQLIQNKIDQILSQDTAPFLLNKRQFNVLTSVGASCQQIIKMLTCPEFELISLHLNETLQILSNLSGKTVSENGMDTIFREFCVGK